MPDQPARPGSYDSSVVWCYEVMPHDAPAAYRDDAIFVVHGIGGRMGGNVAVELRHGFENALGALKPPDDASWKSVPATYIKIGYWGNYGQFEDCFPSLYKAMNKASRGFFNQMWQSRTDSASSTAWWFTEQAWRLPFQTFSHGGADQGWLFPFLRAITYLEVAVFTTLALLYMLLTKAGRQILGLVVGDVNFYLAPQGPIESAIVQNIDRRVRDLFLQMIGLDSDFNDLAKPGIPPTDDPLLSAKQQLDVGGRPQVFKRITWVAHSLGTVVSYNVISDLLHQCESLEKKAAEENNYLLLGRVRRVEEGISRFITLGSPLQKMSALFPGVLRPWPPKYLKQFADEKKWINFYHILDPVSGVLRDPECFAAKNEDDSEALAPQTYHSPKICTLPGLAHVSYWDAPLISQYIIAATFPCMPNADRVSLTHCPRSWIILFLWHSVMLISLVVFLGLALLPIALLAELAYQLVLHFH